MLSPTTTVRSDFSWTVGSAIESLTVWSGWEALTEDSASFWISLTPMDEKSIFWPTKIRLGSVMPLDLDTVPNKRFNSDDEIWGFVSATNRRIMPDNVSPFWTRTCFALLEPTVCGWAIATKSRKGASATDFWREIPGFKAAFCCRSMGCWSKLAWIVMENSGLSVESLTLKK